MLTVPKELLFWRAANSLKSLFSTLCFVGSLKLPSTLLRLSSHSLMFSKMSLTNTCCRTHLSTVSYSLSVAKYTGRHLSFRCCWSPQSSLQGCVIQNCKGPGHQNQTPSGDTNTLVFSVVPASTFLVLTQFSMAEALPVSAASWSSMQDAQSRGWVVVLNRAVSVEYTGEIAHGTGDT